MKINVLDLFGEQVEKTPNAPAALGENTHLSYLELHQQSNQLAHFLIEQGIKKNHIVGICVKSDCPLLVGILGILKAGGVYLPLDPNYPSKRLEYILNDAQPSILLTDSSSRSLFSDYFGIVFSMEKNWQNETKSFVPQRAIDSDDLAYIVYTSGSTGYPKGIMITHRSFPQIVSSHASYYPKDLIGLLIGSVSFDASILTIFHLLISGGTVFLPSADLQYDLDRLIDLIHKHSINFIFTVPSLYSLIMEKSRLISSLKSVSVGGENLPANLPKLHAQFSPNALLYNEYGPSEYAIAATIAKIYDPITRQINPITIGKPLPNTEIYLLDEDLKPVPIGVKGEIYIAGAGLAKGYLNKPQLTSERFIWLDLPNQYRIRVYRSGDIGRYLPNGELEFLGRVDNQVKIRGVRCELGEVEHAICRYPAVKESAVIVWKNRLIAFYTSDSPLPQLQTYLVNFLLTAMLPSSYIWLDSFPRTCHGKIDREALINLAEQTVFNSDKQQPRSNIEQEMLTICKDVLSIIEIGVHDNFLDLGGTSIQIAIIRQRIQESLNITIPILEFYRHPTIFSLGQHLSNSKDKELKSDNLLALEKRKAAFQRLRTKAIEKEMIINEKSRLS